MSLPRALVIATVLVGCACGAPAAEAPAPTPPPPTHVAAPDYEVHEWGLVRGEAGDVLQIGAIAPPIIAMPMVVLKPVLYFHASAPFTLSSVRVAASAGGQIVEAWPLVPLGDHVEWTSVAIDPGGACTPSALPTPADPPCTSLGGGFCEVAGLAIARTEASCVRVGDTTERFLFYRGRSTTLTPPLTYEHVGDRGEIRVTSDRDAAVPGVLVRVWSQLGSTRALAVAPPAPHASITVPPPADDATADAGRAALHASMTELGLTSDEADAFLRAWDASLFGSGEVGAQLDLALAPPVATDAFVYFLPEAMTDDVARLTFDPPPRAVHRAIAVWSTVPQVGSSR